MSKRKMNKSFDGSAYWHFVSNGTEGHYLEDKEASPDQLSDTDVLIQKSELSEEDEEALSLYYQLVDAGMMKKLSPGQRKIWKLRFFRWNSEEQIAKELGISIQSVTKQLARAGAKIKVEIEKRKQKKRCAGYFKNGFKKYVQSVGESETDKEFANRMKNAKPEIEAFLKRNAGLKEDFNGD